MQRKMFLGREQIAVSTHLLSETYQRAEKELKQVTGKYGNRGRREACASGAFVYYHGRIGYTPNSLHVRFLPEDVRIVVRAFNKYLKHKYRRDIVRLNDRLKWSFAMFAKEARFFEDKVLLENQSFGNEAPSVVLK